MVYKPGDVILVPFSFRDRLAERARPAVVVSNLTYNAQGDVVIVAITSPPLRFLTDYSLLDWQAAGLQFASTVRMLLATLSHDRVILSIGKLTDRDWLEVQGRLQSLFA